MTEWVLQSILFASITVDSLPHIYTSNSDRNSENDCLSRIPPVLPYCHGWHWIRTGNGRENFPKGKKMTFKGAR